PGARRGVRLALPAALVQRLDLHPLAHDAQRPAPRPLSWLHGHGPRRAADQEVTQRCAGERGELHVERFPAHGHPSPVDLHIHRAVAEANGVLHAPSSTTTVSTCGDRTPPARPAMARMGRSAARPRAHATACSSASTLTTCAPRPASWMAVSPMPPYRSQATAPRRSPS